MTSEMNDGVTRTNDEATTAKMCAVTSGYYSDPYIKFFIPSRPIVKKPPEINIGYYIRTRMVINHVKAFISGHRSQCQVVNLGAGFDTLFFNLVDAGDIPLNYVEIDLETVINKKVQIIKMKKELSKKISQDNINADNPNSFHAKGFHLVSCDLRNTEFFMECLSMCDISFGVPTLFVAECVLIYLPVESSHELLSTIAKRFSDVYFLNYEQININDRFGYIMKDNMERRNATLYGAAACANRDTHIQRFCSAGWKDVCVLTMSQIFKSLDAKEKSRLQFIEILDELEVLFQLLDHYCFVTARSTME